MTVIKSILFALFVGVAGTFLHDSYRPFGLIVGLLALVLAVYLVRNMYQSRACSLAFSLAWVAVILRASTVGNGGELLIRGNTYGNIFAFGGALYLLISFIVIRKLL